MGKPKKQSSKNVAVGSPETLTHSPFASIGLNSREPASDSALAAQPQPSPAARRGRLVLARETKSRGGKPVVVVRGCAQLPAWDRGAIEALAAELKRALGCGGTVEPNGQIIVQGDRPAQVAEWLRAQGFRVDGVTS